MRSKGNSMKLILQSTDDLEVDGTNNKITLEAEADTLHELADVLSSFVTAIGFSSQGVTIHTRQEDVQSNY